MGEDRQKKKDRRQTGTAETCREVLFITYVNACITVVTEEQAGVSRGGVRLASHTVVQGGLVTTQCQLLVQYTDSHLLRRCLFGTSHYISHN